MASCKPGYTYTTVGGNFGPPLGQVQGPGCVSGSGDWYFLDTGTQTPGYAEAVGLQVLGNTSPGYVSTPTSTTPNLTPAGTVYTTGAGTPAVFAPGAFLTEWMWQTVDGIPMWWIAIFVIAGIALFIAVVR